MNDVTIRIHYRGADGKIEDAQQGYGLEDFGGFLPAAGDTILYPSVQQGRDPRDAANRVIWTVVGRMFNPNDNMDCVALIVEERAPMPEEEDLLPSG